MTTTKRLRGLGAVLEDAVDHGSSAIERVHRATAGRSFAVLERIPPVAGPAHGVHVVHDVVLSGVYWTIRRANRLVGAAVGLALDVAERAEAEKKEPAG